MNRSNAKPSVNPSNKLSHQRQWRGNTLLEVMIALVLLSIGILGAGQLQRLTIFQTRDILQRTQALDLASTTLERLRTHGAQTSHVINRHTAVGSVDFAQIKTSQDCESQGDFCIGILVGTPLFEGDLKPVRVVVRWSGQQGKTHQVALSTMISRFNEFEPRLLKQAAPTDITHEIADVTQ
ncbi:prepilin-type N-terminal cleavage/methylation domain-containing protein [Vibrio ruber]|uniref:type IV pilus modification PilV family protein n=1 Tax=Vibrio ruber TaxID=184755 RepID=UPI0028931393|nr:prepilin-type N-terminal cleavage/methylation domain-containing protein [Vibrio ruber]WNJ95856.1 prepilin-type N-terminal cleavage/methylation domain-containing protein [Vibrio ruber]